MSKIADLIKELCPNGVKKYTIKDICLVTRGRVISKMELQEKAGEYPVYSSQTLNNGVFGKINSYDFDGEYVQWTTDGANAGSIFYRNGKFSVTNVCGLLKIKDEYLNKIRTDYLAYALTIESKKYVNYATSNPKLMSNVMADITVLIPPLEVQEEIVRILDKFGELEAELEAELETRKSQYEFWRDKVFEPKDNWTTKTMEDLCTIITKQTGFDYSATIKPSLLDSKSDETYSFIQNKDFDGIRFNFDTDYYIPKKVADKYPKITLDCPSILFSISGKIGNVGLYESEKKAFIGGAIAICKLKPNLNNKYILYYLQSKYGQQYLFGNIKAASHLNVTVEAIRKINIKFPSSDEQEKIVKILDKFDALTNDIAIGLPAEIELRRKQYEYYRNKLLSFEDLGHGNVA